MTSVIKRARLVILVGLFLFWVQLPHTLAHDFWIEPSIHGDSLHLGLRLGHVDAPEKVVRKQSRIARFVARFPGGTETTVEGNDGDEPAGKITLGNNTTAMVVYQSTHSFSTLAASKFDAYLTEEGLEYIIERRKQRNESHLPGMEAFLRCAKTIVGLESAPTSFLRKSTGLPAELLWLSDVPTARKTQTIKIKFIHGGKPVKNAWIVAKSPQDHNLKIGKRSGKDGTVTLKLPHGGRWIVTSVYMAEMPKGANPAWESFWASLSFEL